MMVPSRCEADACDAEWEIAVWWLPSAAKADFYFCRKHADAFSVSAADKSWAQIERPVIGMSLDQRRKAVAR